MRLSLVVLPGGLPGFNILDKEGDPRVIFHTEANGEPKLQMLGKSRSILYQAPPAPR